MSPREAPDDRLQQAMKQVLLATLPGLLALFWCYGWGVLINLILAASTALVMKRRPPAAQPPADAERWQRAGQRDTAGRCPAALLPVVADRDRGASGLLFGKHLYGGVGKNPFNPAMLGFALAMVLFPQPMTHWPAHGMNLQAALPKS
jgi:electron transport complex protein RnfD